MTTSPDSVTYPASINEVVGPTEAAPWENTLRPTNPWQGLFGFDTITNRFEFWDGTEWRHPLWTSGGTITGNLQVDGTLGVTGTSTLAALSATTGTFSSTLGVTGMLTASGAITTVGALRTSGNIVASGLQSADNATVIYSVSNVSGAWTATNAYAINRLFTRDTSTGPSGGRALLGVTYRAGAGSTNVAWAIDISTSTDGTTGDFAAGGAFAMGGIRSTARVEHNQGGTSPDFAGASGAVWGANIVAAAVTGATNIRAVRGLEINCSIDATSSAYLMDGIKITMQNNTAVTEAAHATLIMLSGAAYPDPKWDYGVTFGSQSAHWPMKPTGIMIDASQYSIDDDDGQPALHGVDFTAVEFSGQPWRSPGPFGMAWIDTDGAFQAGPLRIEPSATGGSIDAVGSYVTAVAVASGGTGCAVGDIYTFGDGGAVTVTTVSGGGVATGITLLRVPSIASGSPPANPLAATAAGLAKGVGLTLNATWNTTARTLDLQRSGSDITVGTDKIAIDGATGQTIFGNSDARRVRVFPQTGNGATGAQTFQVSRVGSDTEAGAGGGVWVMKTSWVLTSTTPATGVRYGHHIGITSGSGVDPGEVWGLLVTNRTQASTASANVVGIYSQPIRDGLPGAGVGVPILGGVIEMRDETGAASSVAGQVRGLEIDLTMNGVDDYGTGHDGRGALVVILAKEDAGGVTPTYANIFGVFATDSAIEVRTVLRPNNFTWTDAVIDCRVGTEGASANTIWLADDQHIALDTSANTRISSDGTTIAVEGPVQFDSEIEMGSGGPTITTGAGAPGATEPVGSIYLRTGGGVGTTLYVSQGAGTWNPVAGV